MYMQIKINAYVCVYIYMYIYFPSDKFNTYVHLHPYLSLEVVLLDPHPPSGVSDFLGFLSGGCGAAARPVF